MYRYPQALFTAEQPAAGVSLLFAKRFVLFQALFRLNKRPQALSLRKKARLFRKVCVLIQTLRYLSISSNMLYIFCIFGMKH